MDLDTFEKALGKTYKAVGDGVSQVAQLKIEAFVSESERVGSDGMLKNDGVYRITSADLRKLAYQFLDAGKNWGVTECVALLCGEEDENVKQLADRFGMEISALIEEL